MADYPITADEIKARLNTLQAQIDAYTADPAKFATLNMGSVQISIADFIRALREEQMDLRQRLSTVPFWNESDIEGAR